MRTKELRHLPAVEDAGQLVGIITDRDLRHAAFGPAVSEYHSARAQRRLRGVGQTLENLRVRDVMTWVVMTERRVGSLPVVDNGKQVGMLTERDVLRALSRERGALPVSPEGFLW
jgi:acetoin utilization protein AcuB